MSEFDQKIQLAIWGALAGGFVSLVVHLLLNIVLPRMRRWNLTQRLSVSFDPPHGDSVRFRVANGGFWTVRDAMLYLALDIKSEDVLPPPSGSDAHIKPNNFVPLSGDQLCWSVRIPTINPMKVDILAKERQPFTICRIGEEHITIPSEEGWPPDHYAQSFVRKRRYTGTLKIVSQDTDARYFHVSIDPDSRSIPGSVQLFRPFENRPNI